MGFPLLSCLGWDPEMTGLPFGVTKYGPRALDATDKEQRPEAVSFQGILGGSVERENNRKATVVGAPLSSLTRTHL